MSHNDDDKKRRSLRSDEAYEEHPLLSIIEGNGHEEDRIEAKVEEDIRNDPPPQLPPNADYRERLLEYWQHEHNKRLRVIEEHQSARRELDRLHTRLLLDLTKSVSRLEDTQLEIKATLDILVEGLGGLDLEKLKKKRVELGGETEDEDK